MPADPQLVASIRPVLARHPEIRLALLFGSRARGVAGPAADLDLAVEVVRGEELDRLGLMAELSSATGLDVDVVDVTPGRRVGYPLLAALVRDAVVVHEGRPHAEAEFRTRALLETSLDRPWYERMRNAYLDRLASSAHG
ncbi:MAG TPA: nucleotidyltransferase domain-containing protein [Thermoanaerobaculia bacterium]|nr:nucleotidyltransferase domain-containing protein [Thermoanaerobaculia bacterium]